MQIVLVKDGFNAGPLVEVDSAVFMGPFDFDN